MTRVHMQTNRFLIDVLNPLGATCYEFAMGTRWRASFDGALRPGRFGKMSLACLLFIAVSVPDSERERSNIKGHGDIKRGQVA